MPNLFSSITIKNLRISNRIVMSPVIQYLATEEGKVTRDLINHYLLRSKFQVGLLIAGHAYVNKQGRIHKNQLGLHSDSVIEGYKLLTEKVHSAGGLIGIQLSHGGTACKKEIIGGQPVGPSSIRHPRSEEMPWELNEYEINDIIHDFGAAALRAKNAGFDMLEIHGAHGYLLNQFFSPLTNRRTDNYGGNREKRIKFLEDIVEEVRRNVGNDFPLFFRLGGDDMMFGGLTVDDAHWAALRLVLCGVDVIDLSGGLGGYNGKGQGYFVYLAEAVRPVVDIPVMISGGIKDPEFANQLILSGKADLVGIGRVLLEDYSWVEKAKDKIGIY